MSDPTMGSSSHWAYTTTTSAFTPYWAQDITEAVGANWPGQGGTHVQQLPAFTPAIGFANPTINTATSSVIVSTSLNHNVYHIQQISGYTLTQDYWASGGYPVDQYLTAYDYNYV